MVFFTCNHCGESVKKPAVEKHYNTKCRGAPKNVSCMDCLKDFHAEEYVAHTKCITEAQKYSGKDYVQKEPRNSGAKKQESWMDIIRAILDSSDYKLSPQARGAFERLQSVDNVPRKKVKFQNFTKNCMRMPVRLTEEVWSVLEKEQEKMKLAKQKENAAVTKNGVDKPVQNGVKREATPEQDHEEPAKKKSKKDKKAKTEKSQDHEDVVDENVEPTKPAKSKKAKATAIEVEAEAATNGDSEPAKKKSKKDKKAKTEKSQDHEDVVDENVEPTKPAKSKKAKATAIEVEAEAATNGDSEPAKKKSKKQKTQTEELIVAEEPVNDTTLEANGEVEYEFKWSVVLEKIVRKNADGIAVEKLKKRVLKKYSTQIGGAELTAKQLKTFEKKFEKNLKKSPALLVEDGTVKAC
ncbi:cell growth-regulating nucleolar protein [Anastrepha obliqua]|uniref:cell growth-regulating nucleolar protein n=1 Tax=Anastrepha obliqua TaxID=95512 RepID=UPI002409CF9F|nr:cell growth-regulating nucleolar protein [Anastrepha obliqua]